MQYFQPDEGCMNRFICQASCEKPQNTGLPGKLLMRDYFFAELFAYWLNFSNTYAQQLLKRPRIYFEHFYHLHAR